jgi:thiamine biosynthesis lipoprotein
VKPGVAAVAAALALAVPIRGSQHPDHPSLSEGPSGSLTERSAYLMGTRARLLVWDATRQHALARLEQAIASLEQTEAQLSTWRADSALSTLNRSPIGVAWQAPPDLCPVFAELSDWQAESGGAFDPSIGRLLQAWDVHDRGRVPLPQDLARARATSGFSLLQLDAVRCTVTRLGDVALDAGAFGKGEALDRLSPVLGDRPWLVDLGGQVAANGAPPGQSGWPVGVAHPLDRQRAYLEVRLPTGSLATSAGSERDLVVAGRRVAHILDPRTGGPAAFRGSVVVWHVRALVADILSTALFVMGPDEGLPWAAARGIAAGFLVPESGGRVSVRATPAFRRSVLFSMAEPPR